MKDSDKLGGLIESLQEVMVTLERSTVTCSNCGHVASVDQEQRTHWEMLNAARDRIAKVSAWMRRNGK